MSGTSLDKSRGRGQQQRRATQLGKSLVEPKRVFYGRVTKTIDELRTQAQDLVQQPSERQDLDVPQV